MRSCPAPLHIPRGTWLETLISPIWLLPVSVNQIVLAYVPLAGPTERALAAPLTGISLTTPVPGVKMPTRPPVVPPDSVNQMLPSGPQTRLAGAAGGVIGIKDLFIDRAVLDDLVGRALGDPEVSGRGIDQHSDGVGDRDRGTAEPVVAGLKLTIWFKLGSVIQNSCSILSQAIAVGAELTAVKSVWANRAGRGVELADRVDSVLGEPDVAIGIHGHLIGILRRWRRRLRRRIGGGGNTGSS